MPRHRLSIGAMFKNERHSIIEWIEHYLYHGVTHFYLIDDGSTDDSRERIIPYIKRGIVNLVVDTPPREPHRMEKMYDKHIMRRLRETDWMLICDLDEFIWSPHAVDLVEVLNRNYRDAPTVTMNHTIFGSNGYVTQPDGIVKHFTKRDKDGPCVGYTLFKYFVNTRVARCSGLHNHWAWLKDNQTTVPADHDFVFNHYMCQSVEIWKMKMARGIGHDGSERLMDEFYLRDHNDVEDTRLLEQNRPLYKC